ncbi:hypothetical protein [Massilia eburnea]|uniref:hypothetical protein n=1 Tax=Massilia eburnea TaxID=1776165 RepID=UPI003D6ACD06
MRKLFGTLRHHSTSPARGYGETELAQISRLYDVEITGDFRLFLMEAGRTSGCALGEGAFGLELLFFPYCSSDVRFQVLGQYHLREDLLNLAFAEMKAQEQYDISKTKMNEFVESKPFFLSCENQTQYFFVPTADGGDVVHRFDENSGNVIRSEFRLQDYLERILVPTEPLGRIWCGELLVP